MFEQSKRTGVAVPFRTCILPGFDANDISKKKRLQLGELEERGDSDRQALWQAWPMLTGFSFTGKCQRLEPMSTSHVIDMIVFHLSNVYFETSSTCLGEAFVGNAKSSCHCRRNNNWNS